MNLLGRQMNSLENANWDHNRLGEFNVEITDGPANVIIFENDARDARERTNALIIYRVAYSRYLTKE